MSNEDAAPPAVDPTVPHAARIWNYWMLRHEAPYDRAEVKDLRRRAVAVA
ncbi:hypothetical protein [Streptomyces sp. CMB-StM0423]|nr:hypothetical protein [Streptomyces sp. CMB-StM0423]